MTDVVFRVNPLSKLFHRECLVILNIIANIGAMRTTKVVNNAINIAVMISHSVVAIALNSRILLA